MSCLHLCPSCGRHVRKEETSCPFCATALPDDFAECTGPRVSALARPLTRAALVLAGATAIGACGKSKATDPATPPATTTADAGWGAEPVAVYGPPPMFDEDASPPDEPKKP